MRGSTHVSSDLRLERRRRARGVPRDITLLGVPVQVDLAWMLGLGLGTWTLATTIVPAAAPERGMIVHVAGGALAALFLMLSIAVHEAGHVIAARQAQLSVTRVRLSLFGGAAELVEPARSPATELRVALAGPAASAVLAASAAVVHVVLVEAGGDHLVAAVAAVVAIGNVALAVLNLVPAMPLDGGRVLAIALAWLTGNRARASAVAAASGRALGLGLMGFALFASASGDAGIAVWAGLIGLTIWLEAARE